MKIIHFVPYYPPERLGGVGEFVARLHAGLVAAGHRSLVVTSGRNSQPGVERISPGPLGWFLKTAAWAGKAAQYDVVHCQAGEAFPVVLLLALRRRRPRILTTFHVSYLGISVSWRPYTLAGRRFGRGLRTLVYRTLVCRLHRLLDRATLRLSDAVNAISASTARDVLGEGRESTARIIYNGLPDLPDDAQDPAVEPVEILYAGSGGHRKRVSALPFVLEEVHRAVPGARLRIVGFEPRREPELRALFAERGLLPYVDYAGVRKSVELPPLYAAAAVLVVPSAYEGLPFVILEAMQSGLPVVATRVSGHPEVVADGENGFLVDPDQPQQMAERCVRLLRDPELRQRMGEAARRTIRERFTLARQTREYLELYRELVALSGGSA